MRETTVKGGKLKGIPCGWPSVTAYYGIPYAAPPVGQLRWKPPQPAKSWEGVRDCARAAARCPQLNMAPGSFYQKEFYPYDEIMDEDCLYLNVWTPAQTIEEKLPVLFWVHGGAFMTGYGHSAHFDGEHFAKKGVIVVTINYRLNIFGWMTHQELADESPEGVCGNYGILDQVAALNWVYENIAAFGGDPTKITVAGQSAGALSIQALITTPLTEGKIARAILQSGGGVTPLPDMRFIPQEKAIANTDISALGVATIAEARALSWQELLERWRKTMPSNAITRTPIQDGFVFPKSLDAMAIEGSTRKVPYIIGYTSDEGIPITTSHEKFVDMMIEEYGEEKGMEFVALCPDAQTFKEEYVPKTFTEHSRSAAEAWAIEQQRQSQHPVYVYCIDRQLPGDNMGAFHAADLWYVFKTFMRSWRPWEGCDYILAESCNSYWANFVKTGNPNGESLPKWEPYTKENPQTMMLGARIAQEKLAEEPRIKFRKDFILSSNK